MYLVLLFFFFLVLFFFFFFLCYGDHRVLHLSIRRQRQMCIRDRVLEYGDYVLSQTPEMLPVLKQAGVVDSGGQGLMEVLKGAYDGFLGKEVDLSADFKPTAKVVVPDSDIDTADIKFGYCTEFIVMLEKPYTQEIEQEFKTFLSSIGDSIVCVNDEDIVKVHVHTNDPGPVSYTHLTLPTNREVLI